MTCLSPPQIALTYPFCMHITLALGSSTIFNHSDSGSIIVRHIKSITLPSFFFKVHGLNKLTHAYFQENIRACFGGSFQYLCLCIVPFWNILHVFTYSLTSWRNVLQYIVVMSISSSCVWPGFIKQWWYHTTTLIYNEVGMTRCFSSCVRISMSSITWRGNILLSK